MLQSTPRTLGLTMRFCYATLNAKIQECTVKMTGRSATHGTTSFLIFDSLALYQNEEV
jgi:hypothetical protein